MTALWAGHFGLFSNGGRRGRMAEERGKDRGEGDNDTPIDNFNAQLLCEGGSPRDDLSVSIHGDASQQKDEFTFCQHLHLLRTADKLRVRIALGQERRDVSGVEHLYSLNARIS